jgi:hypothetical protein
MSHFNVSCLQRMSVYLLLLTIGGSCDIPHRLSPLECLTFSPLAYVEETGGYNVAINYHGREVSSIEVPYTEIQKQLVMEFQQNGSLKYWLKRDYIISPFDTGESPDGRKTISHTIRPSEQLKLKKIYECGKWVANFSDSTVKIDFGKNDLGLLPIDGRYTRLGAGALNLQQVFYFDSVTNGKVEKYEKHINTYFQYY